ncbi:hypothetical protein PsorP6_012990 [Peronosclerospora sorghi]|uniref:Uncharacterized protein n=1 Tax=Peronosclerospora sorghi TaxID=230839 RepID=A0ACC0WFQ2_9STRA|nr:hypothetical protein PsorP6_012990 [Peronosclerospora sorghi]
MRFTTCCADGSKQSDVHSCGIFASFYAREAAQGRALEGVAPPAEEFRAVMLAELNTLQGRMR